MGKEDMKGRVEFSNVLMNDQETVDKINALQPWLDWFGTLSHNQKDFVVTAIAPHCDPNLLVMVKSTVVLDKMLDDRTVKVPNCS